MLVFFTAEGAEEVSSFEFQVAAAQFQILET
jgi:hypothetical protein